MLKMLRLAALLIFLASCRNSSVCLTATQAADVKAAVLKVTGAIAADVTAKGPIAWLQYFEDVPGFFMVSDGLMAFADITSAKDFISNKLVKQVTKIELNWSDIRIDPLTVNLAQVAASWYEDITDSTGNKITQHGYFTGLAQQTPNGWKFLNAHWSVVPPTAAK